MAVQKAAPASGAITTQQAVGLLGKNGARASDPAADTDETDIVVEGDPDDDDAGGDPDDTGDAGADGGSLAAPPFWTAEHKAVFDALPREAQAIILGHERSRVAAVGQALQQAARVRDEANAATQRAAQISAHAHAAAASAPGLDQEAVPGVVDAHGRPMSWSQIDWDRTERTDPRLAGALRATYYDRAHKRGLQMNAAAQAAHAAQARAHTHAFNAYVQSESGKLQQLHPRLAADPAKRQAIGQYLLSHGIDPAAVRGVGAQEMILAEKAMNWDRLNAGRAQTGSPASAPVRAAARPGVRPTAAAAPASPKAAANEAGNRFAQSRSRDDAVALLNVRN
ncbi:MAG TPA: hypothetical protein VGL66_06470 [Caulobacteraceae bacterium]|jgi:hypothetical protein